MPNSSNSLTKILFVILLFVGMNVSAAQGAAQDKFEKFGSWFYQCKMVKTSKVCALRHVQVFKDKSPALTLTIVDSTPADKLRMYFKAPLGVYLPDGLRIRVDSRKQQVVKYLDCNKLGCLGIIGFDEKEVWALKAGKKMRIEFTHQRGKKTITFDVPLDGFSAGIAKVWKPKKAKLKARKSKEAAQKEAVRKEAAQKEAAQREAAQKEAAQTFSDESESAPSEYEQTFSDESESASDEPSGITHWFKGLFSGEEESNESDFPESE